MTLGISVIVPRGCVTAMTWGSGCGGCVVLLWGGFGVYLQQQQQQSLELNRICLQFLEKHNTLSAWKKQTLFFSKTFTFLDGLHPVLGIAFKGSTNSGQTLPTCSRWMLPIKTFYARWAEIYLSRFYKRL